MLCPEQSTPCAIVLLVLCQPHHMWKQHDRSPGSTLWPRVGCHEYLRRLAWLPAHTHTLTSATILLSSKCRNSSRPEQLRGYTFARQDTLQYAVMNLHQRLQSKDNAPSSIVKKHRWVYNDTAHAATLAVTESRSGSSRISMCNLHPDYWLTSEKWPRQI